MLRSWKIVDENQESNGLRTEPCGTPALWFFGLIGNHSFKLTCITRPTEKSESQCVILVGKSNWNILYLSPLCQTLSKAFSTSRKAATTCSPLLKLSMMDWNNLKRWSLVDLALLKPDWCLFKSPIFSRWDLSLCSMTLSSSSIIELIRLMGGSLSGFSNRRSVAIFHVFRI